MTSPLGRSWLAGRSLHHNIVNPLAAEAGTATCPEARLFRQQLTRFADILLFSLKAAGNTCRTIGTRKVLQNKVAQNLGENHRGL